MPFSMIRKTFLKFMTALGLTAVALGGISSADETHPARCFEMRTYFAPAGKLDALHARFRDHTTKLFTKHGMTNVGYWVPKDNTENKLVYLLSYPDLAAREASWKAFQDDPDWKTAKAASEVDGKLVEKVETRFLTLTDFSPKLKEEEDKTEHVFELRTYTTTTGNLPLLLDRFRQHTVALFTRHGMEHFAYFTPAVGQPGEKDTLIYLLMHKSVESQKASFEAFRADPEWVKVKEDSEKAGGGSLTIPDGVKSETLIATDYSPVK